MEYIYKRTEEMSEDISIPTTGAQEPVFKRQLTIQQCSKHTNTDLSIFCRDCNTLICPVCLTQEHQKHEMCDISTIHNEKLQILEKQLRTIDKLLVPFFSEENSKLNEILESHKKHFEEMREKIEDQDKQMKEETTKQTRSLLSELEKHLDNVTEDVRRRKSKLEYILNTLDRNYELMKKTKESDNIKTICKNADDMFEYVKQVDISSAALPRTTKYFAKGEIKVERVANLMGSLHQGTLSDTAKLNFKVLKSYVTDLNAIGKVTTGEHIWIKNSSESVLREIELSDELIQLRQINNTRVRDMAVTKSGDLLLALDNKPHIKIIKKGSQQIDTFYSFENTWFTKPQVPVALHVFGDDKILAGSIEKGGNWESLIESMPRKITVLTEVGEQLQVYEFDSEGKKLFTFPHRITASHKNEDIIIVDKSSNQSGRIVSISKEGRLWIYNGLIDKNRTQEFDPWDVTMTLHDNVIICDMRNHALHILNCEGQIIKYQQTEPLGITLPGCVAIDNNGILIVGCGTNWTNEAKIHSLEFTGC